MKFFFMLSISFADPNLKMIVKLREERLCFEIFIVQTTESTRRDNQVIRSTEYRPGTGIVQRIILVVALRVPASLCSPLWCHHSCENRATRQTVKSEQIVLLLQDVCSGIIVYINLKKHKHILALVYF
jgi:hypothetical protein